VQPISAEQAYHQVLDWSGAFPRDAFDARTVAEVKSGKGSIMRNKAVQQGPRELPPIAQGKPYADSDHDGMSDRWERSNGLNPDKSDSWGDANRNGWPNLDEFLDYAHRQVMSGRPVQ
jgi:pectate lyase